MLKKFLNYLIILLLCLTIVYASKVFAKEPNKIEEVKEEILLTYTIGKKKIILEPFPETSARADYKTNTIYIGDIDGYSINMAHTMIDAIMTSNPKEITFNFHSPGGDVDYAEILINEFKLLNEAGIKVIAKIDKNHACMSACTIIFMNANERIASEDSIFMFHAPHISDGGEQYPAKLLTFQKKLMEIVVKYDVIFGNFCGTDSKILSDISDFSYKMHFYLPSMLEKQCKGYFTKIDKGYANKEIPAYPSRRR